jgi:hypothetical protein
MQTLSLFDTPDDQQSLSKSNPSLDVVKMQFEEAKTLTWQELFDGFDSLYAITYSSGIDFICKLLGKFKTAEIIFGFEGVLSYSTQEIMAYQSKMIERMREKSSQNKLDLLSRIDNGSLRLLVARGQISHEKLYLLASADGRRRVVMGSANMSHAAFGGKQRENICYIDGDKAYDWYYGVFCDLKANSADDTSAKALALADDGEHLEELPIAQTVRLNKVLVIEQQRDALEDVRFALDVKNLAGKLADFVPRADKKGKILLSPEVIKQTRRRVEDAAIQEQELRQEYPQLVINAEENRVLLNEQELDLLPTEKEIRRDVSLFLEYMSGYEKFHGDIATLQSRYFEFANWFFCSPFLAVMRHMSVLYNQNLLPYPVFGLVYGQSKAGKTSFLETLLKMMIGQKTKISAPDFTRSGIEALKRTVKGAPIIVDDLTQTRFNQHAIETIKNDDFGVAEKLLHYPAVVISANEDVKAVAPEVVRRTVICRVQAGLKNTELMRTSIVRRVQRNIGTAFYRAYLGRMLEELPDLLEELRSEEDAGAPDILAVSSEILCDLIKHHTTEPLPDYVRPLSLDHYFSERVTGAQTIRTVQKAWQVNKKAFVVDKKFGQLRYNTGQHWDAVNMMRELPEDLEAHRSGDWVEMNLSKACDFFGVNFRKSRFWER